jgi:hypothetical protein
MGTAKERKERLEQIPAILRENGGKLSFDELFEKVALSWGVRKNTLHEYLETLEAGKVINIHNKSAFYDSNPMILLSGTPLQTPEEKQRNDELAKIFHAPKNTKP